MTQLVVRTSCLDCPVHEYSMSVLPYTIHDLDYFIVNFII